MLRPRPISCRHSPHPRTPCEVLEMQPQSPAIRRTRLGLVPPCSLWMGMTEPGLLCPPLREETRRPCS